MKKSIATVSLSGTLREKLEAVAAAGFTGVEIFENDLLSFDGSAQDVRRFVQELGLEIVVFQPFRDFEGMPEPRRRRNFERAERKFDLMEKLGVDLLLVCSNVSPASLGGIKRAAADLHELGERAAKRGLRIGFEALAWGRHISDYRDAWEVVRRANHPAVGTIIDSFHVLSRAHDLTALSSIPGDRIFLIHVADAPLMQMDYLYWSRHFRCFPGQGRLPLDQFMAALLPTDYDGWFSLEIFNDYFRAASTRQTALDGHRSLILLDEQTTRQNFAVAEIASTSPQANVLGIEFIEFAIEEETTAELEHLLQAFGFRQARRHRSKEITLWQQGEINLLLNSDQEGFAHEYNLLHGPSVSAIGLRVENTQEALERAKMYRCHEYHDVVGLGELGIPAIRALSDHLLYLVDRFGTEGSIWEEQFTFENMPENMLEKSNESASPTALHSIDHLSQVVSPGQQASAVLFYHAVLGFDVAPQYDIVDPHGLIQSQVVETSDHSIRFPLNTSQSQGTLAGRFLSEYFGSGVQHIAFRTDDIFEMVKQLEANGVAILPIPENYYDDLDARYGLDSTLLSTLQQHHILYDRSDTGEFFHVYTQMIAGRFFFEVVQRNHYDDFGAANAPIRLAAQTRIDRTAL